MNGYTYTLYGPIVIEFDSDTGTQQEVSEGPHPFRSSTGFVINNKLYMAPDDHNGMHEFDPVNRTWIEKAAFPNQSVDFRSGAIHSIGGKGYYGSAYYYDNGNIMDQFYEIMSYNPQIDEWSPETVFPGVARYASTSFSMDRVAFILGGRYHDNDNSVQTNEFWSYNTETKIWIQYPDFPGENGIFRNTGFGFNEKAYVFAEGEVWYFDFESNTWNKLDESVPWTGSRSLCVAGPKIILANGAPGTGYYRFFPE